MNRLLIGMAALIPVTGFAMDNPDQTFFNHAAEGGLAEVELGNLAQMKSSNPSVKEFAGLMVKDHTAANDKLKALAAKENVKLPTSPGFGQKATKAKLDVLTGQTFDNSYIKGMVKDHEDTIAEFKKEAATGKDAGARNFAASTLPTLNTHLEKIRAIATAAGVKAD